MGTNTAICIDLTPQDLELFSYQIRCGEPVMPNHKEIQLRVFLQTHLSQLPSKNHTSVTSSQTGTSKGQRDPTKCQSVPGTAHNRTDSGKSHSWYFQANSCRKEISHMGSLAPKMQIQNHTTPTNHCPREKEKLRNQFM